MLLHFMPLKGHSANPCDADRLCSALKGGRYEFPKVQLDWLKKFSSLTHENDGV